MSERIRAAAPKLWSRDHLTPLKMIENPRELLSYGLYTLTFIKQKIKIEKAVKYGLSSL